MMSKSAENIIVLINKTKHTVDPNLRDFTDNSNEPIHFDISNKVAMLPKLKWHDIKQVYVQYDPNLE